MNGAMRIRYKKFYVMLEMTPIKELQNACSMTIEESQNACMLLLIGHQLPKSIDINQLIGIQCY